MEDLLFKLALHQNGSIKFGYAHKSLWHSYVAISPGYKISASLTKIPTAVGNACPRQRWPRQSWLGVSKKSHQKKIEVLTQPYTLSCWHWLGIGWPTHPDLPRTILILKPKLPCLGILLSRRQIGTPCDHIVRYDWTTITTSLKQRSSDLPSEQITLAAGTRQMRWNQNWYGKIS